MGNPQPSPKVYFIIEYTMDAVQRLDGDGGIINIILNQNGDNL